MAEITITGLDEDVLATLLAAGGAKGRSLVEECREVLGKAAIEARNNAAIKAAMGRWTAIATSSTVGNHKLDRFIVTPGRTPTKTTP